jgi:hypothetical protein
MILQTFFDTGFSEIPDTLNPKENGYLFLLGGIIFFSFLILALVKRSNQRVFIVLIQLFFNSSSLEQKIKDSLKLTSFASVFLLVNYFLVFSTCTFLLLNYFQLIPFWLLGWISIATPILLFVIQVGFVWMINWITGATLPTGAVTGNTMIVFELTGVMLSVIALFWILNPEYSVYAVIMFIGIVSITQITRVTKNSFAVLNSGVGWYYILLYFCTLEILPLFVVYYYVQLNFLK